MPDVTGQSLSGNPAHLSTTVEGKIALVVFSFSKAGGKDAQLWDRDVSRLKNDMPPSLHNSTIVSYEDEKLWKQHLDVPNDNRAYVVLLGRMDAFAG